MTRELLVLGTASQVPTKQRSHNGYLLRWDDQGILFDPGEGAQRQLTIAGGSSTEIDRVCITHFHGDHCLGLPGIIQRLSLDRVSHPVAAHFPASGAEYFERLRQASVFYDSTSVVPAPIAGDGEIARGSFGVLSTMRLNHPVESFGYRLTEPDGRRMLPEALAHHGISGPEIGRLQREGRVETPAGTVALEQVSTLRKGQSFAFVMDTGWCEAALELAQDADMLVIESTFQEDQAALAAEAGHLTAAQAGKIAKHSRVSRLVLTHFSQRYPDASGFGLEAAKHFDGDIVVAEDLTAVQVPPRST